MSAAMNKKNLRDTMPTVAAFIDECREAFGVEEVNDAIRGGMNGLPTFWARENGVEVGTKSPAPVNYITAADMVIRKDALPAMPHRSKS